MRRSTIRRARAASRGSRRVRPACRTRSRAPRTRSRRWSSADRVGRVRLRWRRSDCPSPARGRLAAPASRKPSTNSATISGNDGRKVSHSGSPYPLGGVCTPASGAIIVSRGSAIRHRRGLCRLPGRDDDRPPASSRRLPDRHRHTGRGRHRGRVGHPSTGPRPWSWRRWSRIACRPTPTCCTYFVEPHCVFADRLRERHGAGISAAPELRDLRERRCPPCGRSRRPANSIHAWCRR